MLDNWVRRLLDPPRRAVDLLDPRPGEHVVDLGAGVGYYDDTLLARLGPTGKLTLVDINPQLLERYLRRHGPDPRVEVLVSSAAAVASVPSGSVDRVLSAMMLCDVQDKKGVLDEAWRVLRPGGTAFFSFHSSEAPVPSHPLWVPRPRWEELRGSHAWTEVAQGERRSVRWSTLRKPGNPPSPRPQGDPPPA